MLRLGMTLVVSPLLSLITDQLRHLDRIGIPAVSVNSNTKKDEVERIYRAMANGQGNIKLIYVTPEWIAKSKKFMNNLQKLHERKALDRIAIGIFFSFIYEELKIF